MNSLILSLLLEQEEGLTLPASQFFCPNGRFWAWADRYLDRTRQVVEVGAGMGHVAAGLAERGFRVCAVDLHWRDRAVYEVQIQNSMLIRYRPGWQVLVCRPCHGPWVEHLAGLVLGGGAELYYVGKQDWLLADLGPWAGTELVRRVGAAEEGVWRVG